MRQQSYNPDGIDRTALDEYARCLAAPGTLSAGINYFRAHRIDAGHNRENARTRLAMPVMTMGAAASIDADLAPEVKPLVERLHSVMIDECGHYLAEEQPARVVEELLRFFAA